MAADGSEYGTDCEGRTRLPGILVPTDAKGTPYQDCFGGYTAQADAEAQAGCEQRLIAGACRTYSGYGFATTPASGA